VGAPSARFALGDEEQEPPWAGLKPSSLRTGGAETAELDPGLAVDAGDVSSTIHDTAVSTDPTCRGSSGPAASTP
jgi:hypothetical protein